MVKAIDYTKTGKIRWTHTWEGGGMSGLLRPPATSCSRVTDRGQLVAPTPRRAPDVARRRPHGREQRPITYPLDGQYVVVAAGDNVGAFGMKSEAVNSQQTNSQLPTPNSQGD